MLLILCIELIVLFFLSRTVTQHIFEFFMLLFRVRSIAVSLLLAIQFPGTVIHELAHLFTAEILGVKTGKLRLEPESIREDSIQAGSVMVAESDPFRRYAIGLAPLFWGITALTALSYFLLDMGDVGNWGYVGVMYLMFAISNTMFPSPEDTKGIFPFLVALSGFFILGYVFGIRIHPTGIFLDLVTPLITTLTKSIGVVLVINSGLWIFTVCASSFMARMLHVRINHEHH